VELLRTFFKLNKFIFSIIIHLFSAGGRKLKKNVRHAPRNWQKKVILFSSRGWGEK
jgi:hypothetical protein